MKHYLFDIKGISGNTITQYVQEYTIKGASKFAKWMYGEFTNLREVSEAELKAMFENK